MKWLQRFNSSFLSFFQGRAHTLVYLLSPQNRSEMLLPVEFLPLSSWSREDLTLALGSSFPRSLPLMTGLRRDACPCPNSRSLATASCLQSNRTGFIMPLLVSVSHHGSAWYIVGLWCMYLLNSQMTQILIDFPVCSCSKAQ